MNIIIDYLFLLLKKDRLLEILISNKFKNNEIINNNRGLNELKKIYK